jgi:hypothetical protein
MALGQKLIPKSPRNINFGFKILKEKEFNWDKQLYKFKKLEKSKENKWKS